MAKKKNGAAAPPAPAPTSSSSTTSGAPARNGRAPTANVDAILPSSKKSWLLLPLLIAFFLALSTTTLYLHYKLPSPITLAQSHASEAAGDGARFSEEAAMQVMSKLTDDIGYRIVGTREHVQAEEWLLEQLRKFEGWHETGIDGSRTQVEVWQQIGDGAHRFDFMHNVVWKKYYGMSNVVVRLSDGTDEGKEHAVLVNAHLDSTLPSPGAADDGVGVAIMMELLRVYTAKPRPKLRHSVILLFNNGEESLQDASHLYITQHNETRQSVRAVVNLEACGTSGPELLFQATSSEMIEAYAKVPYPFGTILANDVFSTGLILSDTDFRQFVEYGGLSGLDMAIVGNSYLYHTRRDVPENIEAGATQHFGENVLAIVDHLVTSPASKLVSVKPTTKGSPWIYFSLVGKYFVLLPPQLWRAVSMTLVVMSNSALSQAIQKERHLGSLRSTFLSIAGVVLSLIAAIASANVVAIFMTKVLGKGMSWFSHELLSVGLYGPPAMTAILSVQLGLAKLVKPEHRPYLERANLNGLLVYFIFGLLAMNAFGIGTAYIFGIGVLGVLTTILINDLFLVGFERIDRKQVAPGDRVHPLAYFIISLAPAVTGVEGLVSFLDLFVPLTGRMGEISPADNIIASIIGTLTFLCLPGLLVLAHRFGTKALKKAVLVCAAMSVLAVAIYASPSMKPYDEWHPKRLFVHQVENITSGEWFMNLGSADPAPGMRSLVDDVQRAVGIPGQKAELVEMNAWNTDFDILYPVSDFLTPYKFQLPTPEQTSIWANPAPFIVRAKDEKIDLEAGTRRVTLEITHPGIIWSVVAFDAHILEWDLPVAVPSGGKQRHHIKEVSRNGLDTWSLSVLIKLDEDGVSAARARLARSKSTPQAELIRVPSSSSGISLPDPLRDASRLWIDYSGLDALGLHSARGRTDEEREKRPGVETFERMDDFLLRNHPEVDSMLLNVVAGVAQV